MRLVATFYGVDDNGDDMTIGTVTWDGENAGAEPAKARFLADVAASLMDQADPEKAMHELPRMYKSAYLRAAIEEKK